MDTNTLQSAYGTTAAGARMSWMKYTRFVMILGIVLTHCSMLGDSFVGAVPDAARVMVSCLSHGGGMCVQVFFMMSGYLFFRNVHRFDTTVLRSKLTSRVRTVLVPFVLWNIVGAVLFLIKVYAFGYDGAGIVVDGHLNVARFALSFVTEPYDFVLWFLRDLFILCLMSPLVWQVARRGWLTVAVVALLVLGPGWTVHGAAYLLGAYAACNPAAFAVITRRDLAPFTGVAAIVGICALSLGNLPHAVYYYLYLATVVCMANAFVATGMRMESTVHSTLLNKVVQGTFFIYVFHGLFCTLSRKVAIAVFGLATTLQCMASYTLTFIMLAVGSIAAYLIMKSVFPRATAVLIGSR